MGLFEKYQTTTPSRRLRRIREAKAIQTAAVERYREPRVTLDLMRRLGYRRAEAMVTKRVIKYKNPEAFLDRLLLFNWRNEAEEIPAPDLSRFRSEATEALARPSKDSKFLVSDEMVFFTGLKL